MSRGNLRQFFYYMHGYMNVMSRPQSYQSRDQNQIRPLSSQLVKSLGKPIMVAIKIQNRFIKGKLMMFDMHLNLIIDNALEIIKLRDGRSKERQFKTIILRGDSIKFIETSGTRIMISNDDEEVEF
jgi:small nuclear ribonucleoprotein (snRNP)-like protein